MTEFSLHMEGTTPLRVAVSRMDVVLRDIKQIEQPIYAYLRNVMKRNFATEGRYLLGEEWIELPPKYARWKAIHHPGKKILHLTGALKGSLTSKTKDSIARRRDATSLEFGTSLRYGLEHHLGIGHVPNWPWMGLHGGPRRHRPIFVWSRREAIGIARIWQRALVAQKTGERPGNAATARVFADLGV